MAGTDYYQTLGVSRKASADEIRKAYKKLSRENHPDVKPDDKSAAERFKQVQEAYGVLSDPQKREQYDQFGAAFAGQGARRASRGAGGGGGVQFDINDLFGGQVDLGDLFGNAFSGAGPRRQRATKGQDITARIEVSFQVAAEGGNHELNLQTGGTTERLSVKIPPGVSTDSVIRLAGQGHPGQHGGPRGDVLVKIAVAPHPYFRREGRDLFVEVPVTVSEAALGAKIEVPTLSEGHVVVTVPPATSSGTKLRLRGKGVLDPKTGQRGDQFATIKIVAPLPQQLNDRTRQLLQDLAEAAPQAPRQNLW